MINFLLFFGIEELREAADLFVVLLVERVLDHFLEEVKHILNASLFPDFIGLFIKGKGVHEGNFDFSRITIRRGIEYQTIVAKEEIK